MPAWVNLPNLLTILRMAMVPVVVYFIVEGRYLLAGWLFGAAAFTDILDGLAARGMGVNTQVGAYLDPIADKCLLSGVFLALGWSRMVPRWMVAIVLGRDLYILLAASACLLWTPLRKFPPSLLGKASTFMQISTVVAWLVRDAYGTAPLVAAADILMWFAVALAFASGFEYTIRGVRLLRAAPPKGRAV